MTNFMSWYYDEIHGWHWGDLREDVRNSITANKKSLLGNGRASCGCHVASDTWLLCDYHDKMQRGRLVDHRKTDLTGGGA